LRLRHPFAGLGTAIAVATVALAHCTDNVAPEVVASVRVSPDSVEMFRGDTFHAGVLPLRSDGVPAATRSVRWSSADSSVATVDDAGNIVAHNQGVTTVTARVDTVTGSVVVRSYGTLRYLAIDKSNVVLRIDALDPLGVLVWGDTGNVGRLVTHPGFPSLWTATNEHVAAVSPIGVVIGRTADTTTVSLTVHGRRATTLVHVFSRVTSLAIGPDTLTMAVGAALSGLPVLHDSASDLISASEAHWTSRDPGVVTVDSMGTIAAVAPGTATIVGAVDSVRDSVLVHVRTVAFRSAVTSGFSGWACGLSLDSLAFCWGPGLGWGELQNAQVYATGPVGIVGGVHFKAIDVGTGPVGCGLTGDGTAYCWGWNAVGRLGHPGLIGDAHAPVPATTSAKFASLSTSFRTTCALTDAGDAYCWGGFYTSPTKISGVPVLVAVTAGSDFGCGLAADSSAYCWGSNYGGQLGNGSDTNSLTPQPVSGGYKWTTISAGGVLACGLVAGGVAYCWGDNYGGTLGNDSIQSSPVPVSVTTNLRFSRIVTGGWWQAGSHVCGIVADGSAYCWGGNTHGELGTGSAASSSVQPLLVTGGLDWAMLDVGFGSTCGVSGLGVAYCWGNGYTAGNGTTTDRNVPTRVMGQP